MPSFIANTIMQFKGLTRRTGSILEVDKDMLELEIAKGLHRNGKPNSGLLNHCSPADDETAALCKKLHAPVAEAPAEMTEEEKKEEIAKLQEEMDVIGAAYDRRWGLERMKKELVKAKIEKGA